MALNQHWAAARAKQELHLHFSSLIEKGKEVPKLVGRRWLPYVTGRLFVMAVRAKEPELAQSTADMPSTCVSSGIIRVASLSPLSARCLL